MTALETRPDRVRDQMDVNAHGVRLFGAGFAATLLLVGLAVWFLFAYLRRVEPPAIPAVYPLSAERPVLPPEPRLQTAPEEDLRAFRAEEDAALGTYGWIDQADGVVRIPIERAMALTVERGLPARTESEAQNAQ